MSFVRIPLKCWSCLILFLCCVDRLPATDVVVYGATPGGIAAAVSAAKGGHEVLLIEPTQRVGGLLTSGLSNTDFRTFEALTGFFYDFSQRVEAEYAQIYGEDSEQVRDSWRGTHGEPRINLRILNRMLVEFPNIEVLLEHSLSGVSLSPIRSGRQAILSIELVSSDGISKTVTGLQFIDGSYEGDLMAMAGESYHVGRESRKQYGEPFAGNEEGQADGQVQGYNLRLIMTYVEENKRPVQAPEGYKREDFLGALQHFRSGELKRVFAADRSGIFRAHEPHLPNGKTDMNDTPHSLIRLSMPDINDEYPDGDRETRQHIIQQHYYHNVGLLYFLQNDSEVPSAIQNDARRWALCKDEFEETDGLPPQLYIREARRMVGQHVFTGNDTVQVQGDARGKLHTDSIAIGDYVHNCHGTGRTGTRFNGQHDGEFYKNVRPYQIPFGVIVPQKTENLLVPVACSASHFGFGALRLEPIWSSLGQAAGWTAHLALEESKSVQDVSVPQLQSLLHKDRSATIYVTDVPPESDPFAAVQWFGTQGGFHGLENEDQPDMERIAGQYFKAHPGHEVKLASPLTSELRQLWQTILPVRDPNIPQTRQEWIKQAYADSLTP